jgi:hypothetical protein
MQEEKPLYLALEFTKALIAQHKVTSWEAAWEAYSGLIENAKNGYYDYDEPFELTKTLIEGGHLNNWRDVCTAYVEISKKFHEWRSS